MPTSNECEADALPPSHHSWIEIMNLTKKENSFSSVFFYYICEREIWGFILLIVFSIYEVFMRLERLGMLLRLSQITSFSLGDAVHAFSQGPPSTHRSKKQLLIKKLFGLCPHTQMQIFKFHFCKVSNMYTLAIIIVIISFIHSKS